MIRFPIAVKLIALGHYFRRFSRQLQVIHQESCIDEYGGYSDISVSNYVRMVYAVSLSRSLKNCYRNFGKVQFDSTTQLTKDVRMSTYACLFFGKGCCVTIIWCICPCLTEKLMSIPRVYSARPSMLCSRTGKSLWSAFRLMVTTR